ncbi:alpha-galactosidase [Microlunatus soli]|uniref:Alpha-galactosidase n=2 Tax=Microlunatus soli TaxID=630515 RepID=A0A1H1R1S1_9ACTN|nr:alpha-galactosidase [Microlunatus soli]
MIEHGADDGIYLLTGDDFGYALAVEPDPGPGAGPVRHLHWGAAITLDDARNLDARPATRAAPSGSWSQPRADQEEYVVDGGYRHDEPALSVEFADGVRSLDLRSAGVEVDVDELVIRLVDRVYPFEVMLHYRVEPGLGALVRSTELINRGAEPVLIHRAATAGWALPPRTDYRLTSLSGGYAAETQLTRRPVRIGRIVLESRTGITGHENQPWLAFDVDAGDDHGEVWSVALAWSGVWRATAQSLLDGGTHLTIGTGGELPSVLAAGERLDLPPSVGIYGGNGFDGLARRWHRYEIERVLPQPAALRPVLYNSWEATGFDVTAAGQLALARTARDLGIELFVIDDGWFRPRDDDTAGLGDWYEVPRRFPDGLRAVADEVHRMGLAFGLWVEPEMVSADSDLYRRRPDWIHRWPTREPTLQRHQYVLDFGRAEVVDWALRQLDRLVSDLDLDYLKWDVNRSLAEPYPGPRRRNPWLDHVRGFYRVLDGLRERHPELLIETCAAGGGRVDQGILSRSDWAWPSDNTDARDRLSIQHGFTQVHPTRAMACWVTDTPGVLSGRTMPLRFRFHVAMTGVLGIGADIAGWTAEESVQGRELIATYRRLRPTIQQGERFRLGAPDPERPFGVLFRSADGERIVIFAFALSIRHGARGQDLPLAGLDPTALYRDDSSGQTYSGSLLLHRGLRVELRGDYASTLITLSRVVGTSAGPSRTTS